MSNRLDQRNTSADHADERPNYDHTSNNVKQPALVPDLQKRVDGGARFDTYTRQLYVADASAYEETLIDVIFPASTEDTVAVVSYCSERGTPVLPRGAGASLTGQTVNKVVVLDFTRYVNTIVSVDTDARYAQVQSGVVLAELNEALSLHKLKFAPDPAAGDRSVIGGAIGSNSTGVRSLRYGKTDAYVEKCEVVLADGTVATLGETDLDRLRERVDSDGAFLQRVYTEVVRIVDGEADEVKARFPKLRRNVSGYNLNVLAEEAETGIVNLTQLMAGSEGTLAVVTEAKVALELVPEAKTVSLLFCESVFGAVIDMQHVPEHNPATIELIDGVLIGLARDTADFGEIAALAPDDTHAGLLVKFYADDDGHGRSLTLGPPADRISGGEGDIESPKDHSDTVQTFSFVGVEAHSEADREQFWKLRKAGLPILLSRASDMRHISFIEDCTVPPKRLPEFVGRFQTLLEAKNRGVDAAFYAHTGPGVLYVRPLVDTKATVDRRDMVEIADAMTSFVIGLSGNVSGEHGDGHTRTQWNRELCDNALWDAFRDLKTAFDSNWLPNPGNVYGDHDMTEHLRYDGEYSYDTEFEPSLNWENENNMQGMVELCRGCGECREGQDTSGGMVCSTYRAADREIMATRGRANLLQQVMGGDLPDDLTDDEFTEEMPGLYIGCKRYARDCPNEVNMAKLKIEVMYACHQEHGSNLHDELFANFDALAPLGSTLAPISNLIQSVPGVRTTAKKTLGIACEQTLPEFQRGAVRDWFESRGGAYVAESNAERKAVFFVNSYTNYSHAEVGKATVRVLEATGVHIQLIERTDNGRPALSKGFVEESRDAVESNVTELAPHVRDGWDVALAEPSGAVVFQSGALDLCDGPAIEFLAANAYRVYEYLDSFRFGENVNWEPTTESVAYHGHCHQKTVKKDHHAVGVLRRAGYKVDPLDSGCCGMTGNLGYESKHYSLGRSIGEILFGQIEVSEATAVTAPRASCRTQLSGDRIEAVITESSLSGAELDREGPPTPVELLDYCLPN